MTVVLVVASAVCVAWVAALVVRRRRQAQAHSSVERFGRALDALAPEPSSVEDGGGRSRADSEQARPRAADREA